jgi:stearoyl-CoA desaturase (delta-9 desaturase)
VQSVQSVTDKANRPVPLSPELRALDAGDLAKHEPWTQPWWRPTAGDGPTLFWIVLIHVLSIVGLILVPLPGWRVLLAALALHFLGGLGTTVCYHRAIAHKSVKLHPAVRNVLTFFAMLNGSGSPLSWAAYHRLHHAKSDTPEDISSPRVGGFWWSHLRWLWQAGKAPIAKYCRDIDVPALRGWTRVQIPVLALTLLIGLPFGLAAFFWMGPIRVAFALHSQCFVNSICHMRPDAGPDEQTARNVRWLSVLHLGQGENWHQNHHDRPGSARLGWGASQLDLGWATILLLERVGLATDVRRPTIEPSLDVAA